jgi:hypothetical protein
MKASKIIFAIGFIILVAGIFITIIPRAMVTWHRKKQLLVNSVITVMGGGHQFSLPKLVFVPEASKDIRLHVLELPAAREG